MNFTGDMRTKRLLLFVMASCCMIFGSLTLIFKEKIFATILNSQLTIKEGTAAYMAWVETPIPVYTKFYFFDMLNPRDLFHKHEKPILEERGPYVFRETQKKVDLQWHPNGTVTYKRMKHWYFERDMSVGPLSDVVTTINVPVVGSAEFVRGSFFMEWGISDMLANLEASIFVKKTVGELLFEGYEDDVMTIGADMNSEASSTDDYSYGSYDDSSYYYDGEMDLDLDMNLSMYDDEEEDIEKRNAEETTTMRADVDKMNMDRFGWFYDRNGTTWADGRLEMHTGEGDIGSLGRIETWQSRDHTDAFEGECGKVKGSADGLFPPGISHFSNSIQFYSTDLCRPLTFTKSGQESLHGISVTTFDLAANNFANTSVCPDNKCYNNNIPSGVQNVTQCKMKSPAFVSRPHFYQADPSYLGQFQYGMRPDAERHGSSFWVEPESSIPVKVEMRLQLNVLLRKVEGIEYLFKNLQEVMYPVFWFESISVLPESMAGPLNMLIILPIIMTACGIFSIVSSFIIVFLLIVCSNINQNKESKMAVEEKAHNSIIKQLDIQYNKVPITERDIIATATNLGSESSLLNA